MQHRPAPKTYVPGKQLGIPAEELVALLAREPSGAGVATAARCAGETSAAEVEPTDVEPTEVVPTRVLSTTVVPTRDSR